MFKLTKRTVDCLEVTVNDYLTWDRDLRGFGVRVYPSVNINAAFDQAAFLPRPRHFER